MKILLSHPTGNANVRAAAEGFLKADILGEFNTAIAVFPGSIFHRLSGIRPLAEFRRRSFNEKLRPFTNTFPWTEIGRFAALKSGMQQLTKHETGMFCIDAVYRSMDRHVGKRLKHARKNEISGVYAYEDSAVKTFVKAKSRGLSCFYDLPIGYWRCAKQLLEKEREQWPDWVTTLSSFNDSQYKLALKDQELQLADKIFVASQFTADTLKHFPGKLSDIKVVPYGFPPVVEKRHYNITAHHPLKLLFVGGLSQRKGIANLFAAVKTLGHYVELTVVGQKTTNSCVPLNAELSKHRWIPSLPHLEVLKLMQTHDVLVFPSLFEGFGLVITEAMSQGTPVITTERTAGPDLIVHGQDGWLIEAGSTDALKTAIETILFNPEIIRNAGREAMERARIRPWEVYGRELAEAIVDNT
ncbi:glycosyltransferase family 4 protein [Segetibacter koreensis]|uniref:glycosyltransferase family 4 protein n=1 Tax=Segetibacter koreensis TaxID=398037 RepID=UPI000377006D|nr:glycosyltransferase family 4 protein [Segetibacter koreensis]